MKKILTVTIDSGTPLLEGQAALIVTGILNNHQETCDKILAAAPEALDDRQRHAARLVGTFSYAVTEIESKEVLLTDGMRLQAEIEQVLVKAGLGSGRARYATGDIIDLFMRSPLAHPTLADAYQAMPDAGA